MNSGLRSGKLTKWKDDRGFGFIQPDDGSQDVFLHATELKGATRRPQENDTIYYRRVVDSDGKVRACNAFILGARNKSIAASASLDSNLKSNATSRSNFPIVEVLLLSILPGFGAAHFALTTRNFLLLILYPAMSLTTYFLYADDKSRAQRKVWRTSEQTLHLCELAGGWLGGFIAQRIIHHKSQKASYQAVFWSIVTLHHAAWLFWLLWGKTMRI